MPEIAPWDFAWDNCSSPDKNGLDDIDYLTTSVSALTAALHSEKNDEKLYRHVAEQTPDPDVKSIANEMAELQLDQIKILQQRLDESDEVVDEIAEDMDPPNIAE